MLSLRSLFTSSSALVLCACALCACATASGTLRPLGPDHPASIRAREAPVEDPAAFLHADARAAPPSAPPAERGAVDEGARPSGAYVCPMHPQATAEAPGRCPECGMALVPRKANEEHRDGR
jgi:hypothetical protein